MSKNKNGTKMPEQLEFQFPQKKESISFGQFMYNSKDGSIMGRTPLSWVKILFFYSVFYIVLAALFGICMQALFNTLSDTEPKWKLSESLIGTNPGLGFRPLSDETERGSVIQFDTNKPAESKFWIDMLDEFFEPYQNPAHGINQKICSFNDTSPETKVCAVSLSDFEACGKDNGYGFTSGQPCVFLKLNKIYGWEPEFYNDPKNLPKDMPEELKEKIQALKGAELNQVWVSCKGQHSLDQEYLRNVTYYPGPGFPSFYYPFKNQLGYLSPLVAVQFTRPQVNQLINIECRAWAKNIVYSGSNKDRKGSVTFQLLIDHRDS